MVQRWWDTSQCILETQNLVSIEQEKVFFPPSDSANKHQQQSRAGMMGSGNTDIAAPFSLSEQNMEVKQRAEASETSHLKIPQKTSISLFFPQQHQHFLISLLPGRWVSIPWYAEQCTILSERRRAPELRELFSFFFSFSLGHNLIFWSELAEHIV